MAQSSMFWPTSGVGDGASQYTDAQLFAWLRRTFLRSLSTEGVHAGHLNELAVSGATSPLSIASGAAIVDGIPYENTAPVALAILTPSVGTTGHRVVLRASWAAQTVRVVDISSADGVAAIPAAVQTPGVTYDITLATLTITVGGAITVTDARSFLHYTTRVNATMIDDESITPAKLVNRTRKFLIPPDGAYNLTDSIGLFPTGGPGLVLPDNKASQVSGHCYVPSDFVSLTRIAAVMTAGASGNAWIRNIGSYNPVGASWNGNPQEIIGYAAVAFGTSPFIHEVQPLSLVFLLPNSYITLQFNRDATLVADTINSTMSFMGWLMEYIADG